MMLTHVAPHGGNVGKLLEAPQARINRFKYIADANRRTYAGISVKYNSSLHNTAPENIRNLYIQSKKKNGVV